MFSLTVGTRNRDLRTPSYEVLFILSASTMDIVFNLGHYSHPSSPSTLSHCH